MGLLRSTLGYVAEHLGHAVPLRDWTPKPGEPSAEEYAALKRELAEERASAAKAAAGWVRMNASRDAEREHQRSVRAEAARRGRRGM